MYNSVHFTINLTQERVFIDRFYRINHTKTYNFHAPTLVTSASHKTTAKMRYSFTKITPFDEETTFRHTFLSSDLQCLPPGDPRILCAKHRSPITGKSSIGNRKRFSEIDLVPGYLIEQFGNRTQSNTNRSIAQLNRT